MTTGPSVRLADLTKDEFAEAMRRGRWLLLPFGAVEAHGPHLALGTDMIDAAHVCRRVAERVGGLVAPALPYGVCRTMRRFPGTVSLSPATLGAVVREVVAEYVRHGARRATRTPDEGNVRAMRDVVADVRPVSDEAMLAAVGHLLLAEHVVAEPAGAAPIAAFLQSGRPSRRHLVLLVTGANIASVTLRRATCEVPPGAARPAGT